MVTPEYQQQYADDMKKFHAIKRSEFNIKDQEDYVETLDPEEKEKFMARHDLRTEIGANSDFTGNGLTKSNESSTTFGMVETLTLENNPPPIVNMKNVMTVNLTRR